MDFFDEELIGGLLYVNFKVLEISGQVDMNQLNYLVEKKSIEEYVFFRETMIPVSNFKDGFFSGEGWDFDKYFKKSDIEKHGLIPSAANNRKAGLAKTIRASMDRAIQAGILVGTWIAENKFIPAEITKDKVQTFLYDNHYREPKVFEDVWKCIPHKNSGGRPPNK